MVLNVSRVELMAWHCASNNSDVCIDSYMDPPIENKHYIRASSPQEFKEKVTKMTKLEWQHMSNNCYEWYQKNVESGKMWQHMMQCIFYT